jgi:type IX secretion system PorP/SprF family membrane protein
MAFGIKNKTSGLRRWGIVIPFLALCFTIRGQHVSQYSLQMHERYGFNPAFGGMERSLAASLHYRKQWSGLTGSPDAKILNAHLPVYLWQGGVGMQLYTESQGAEKQSGISFSYNYIYEAESGLYSFGLRAGIFQKSLDGTKLRTPEGNYEGSNIDHQDPNLPEGKVSGVSSSVDAGIYYAGSSFEAGLSMTGYYPGGIQLGDSYRYDPLPAFHLFGEYIISGWEEVSLYPTAYLKSDFKQTQAELAVRAEWQNLLSGGIGYRGFGKQSTDALLLFAGVRLSPKFFLYYGYDIGLSQLQVAHEGTHELLIRYNLGEIIGAGLPPRTIYNPRHL